MYGGNKHANFDEIRMRNRSQCSTRTEAANRKFRMMTQSVLPEERKKEMP